MRRTNVRLGTLLAAAATALVCGSLSFAAPEETITVDELAAVRATESARVAAIEKVYGSVVAIYGNDRGGGGSGVLYDPEGYALTNYHVVAAGGEEGWAGLANGKLYRWKLIGIDPGGDVAIIKLTGEDKFPISDLGDSRTVRVGDWAMAMGNPFVLAEDQRPTVTLGIVSAIQRYQPGAGKNSLVYGNCIQVDSSINPGNSGGPLFSMAGHVMGINGRGSFEERGRVNVGVGYAISMEQIKNFIPDLLSTKVAQHGTLDAVFTDRVGGVLCSQINLDSKIAKAGLQLGDRLVKFDGQKITNANHYLNLICTLPAKWPVEVVYEREGQLHTSWVRLDPLAYAKPKAAPPRGRPGERPAEPPKPAEPKPSEPKPGDSPEKKSAPPAERPKAEVRPAAPPMEPGKIRNAALNREQAERVLKDWRKSIDPQDGLAKAKAIRWKEKLGEVDDKSPESRQIAISADGRFRVAVLDGEKTKRAFGWDGETYWTEAGDKVTAKKFTEAEDELDQSIALTALAALYQANPAAAFTKLELEGSDKVLRRRAYKLRGELKSGQTVYLWFQGFDDAPGAPAARLLKIAAQRDGEASDQGWTIDGEAAVADVKLANARSLVGGLAERQLLAAAITDGELLAELPENLFRKPDDKKPDDKKPDDKKPDEAKSE